MYVDPDQVLDDNFVEYVVPTDRNDDLPQQQIQLQPSLEAGEHPVFGTQSRCLAIGDS